MDRLLALARRRDKSPKTDVFHSGLLTQLTPTLGLHTVPSYPKIWLREGELIFHPDQVGFSPPPALTNEMPDGSLSGCMKIPQGRLYKPEIRPLQGARVSRREEGQSVTCPFNSQLSFLCLSNCLQDKAVFKQNSG